MYPLGRIPHSAPRGWRPLALVLAIAVLCAALAGATATATASGAGQRANSPNASSAALCTALITKKGKLVPVYESVYKYVFKKVKGTQRYARVIAKVRQKMKVSCAKQCVAMKKRKGKLQPVYVNAKKKVTIPRGGRLVTVKRKQRVFKFVQCKIKRKSESAGTPVSIKLLDGSKALLDFGAFQREAPVTGSLKGFVPGGLNLSVDNQVTLTRGSLNLLPTDIFIDDDCNGRVTASIRTGDPTTIGLDPTRSSTSTVFANGTVTATTYVVIHVPLELRNDDNGCDAPYLTTGYSEFNQTFFLKGKLDPKQGLAKLKLTSAPQPVDVPVCLSLGEPTSPCNGFQIPLAIQISTQLYVAIQVG